MAVMYAPVGIPVPAMRLPTFQNVVALVTLLITLLPLTVVHVPAGWILLIHSTYSVYVPAGKF
jgi:hypothetical protein